MSFVLNERAYAVPLTDVAEITPYQRLNQMPHTPEDVVGLLDLRGSVLPVICLRSRMGLPKKEHIENDTIIIVSQNDSRIGILVDTVESVITVTEEQHAHISPLLEGKDGVWVKAILLLKEKVVVVLSPEALVNISKVDKSKETETVQIDDIELRLDAGLRELIEMAGSRDGGGSIIPQLETVISHNESEVTKVLEKVEDMLASTDQSFNGLHAFKQEAAMSGIKTFDSELAEMDKVTQDLQMGVFDVMQQLQFQDIVRQKLERVLRYIVGMQDVVHSGFGSA
uniref:Positive regulator of CheA protein activity (CheW) n=1 Tax=uncultured bacterium contig00001 TaxID=1181493 RepID=A0A806KML7_9BACT|nr:positive regulator of CheA protein activity (CheW) [uncultured bacterium contig00001]